MERVRTGLSLINWIALFIIGIASVLLLLVAFTDQEGDCLRYNAFDLRLLVLPTFVAIWLLVSLRIGSRFWVLATAMIFGAFLFIGSYLFPPIHVACQPSEAIGGKPEISGPYAQKVVDLSEAVKKRNAAKIRALTNKMPGDEHMFLDSLGDRCWLSVVGPETDPGHPDWPKYNVFGFWRCPDERSSYSISFVVDRDGIKNMLPHLAE
jgi:hypothetical protein